MRRPPSPPRFPDPLQREYLITIYRTRQDPIVQTLLLEIARLHDLVRQAEDCRQSIAAELQRQGGGQLVAAHKLRVLLASEPALLRPKPRPRAELPEDDSIMPDDVHPPEPPCYRP